MNKLDNSNLNESSNINVQSSDSDSEESEIDKEEKIDYLSDSESESENESENDEKLADQISKKYKQTDADKSNSIINTLDTLADNLSMQDTSIIKDKLELYSSDSDEDDYLEKLKFNRDFINKNHQEVFHINHQIIEKMCNIIRNSENIIDDPNHRTLPILSKYEIAKIIGLRTKQINNGSKPFIKVNEEIIDGEIIALMELKEKKIPFIIKRPISNNKFEYWKLQDLELII